MESKTIRKKAQDIQDRFFEALDLLIESGEISSLAAFCKEHDLHRAKYSNLRTFSKDKDKPGTGYKFIDIDALAYLCENHNISSDWILSGKGGMFRK